MLSARLGPIYSQLLPAAKRFMLPVKIFEMRKVFISFTDQGDTECESNFKKFWAVDLWRHTVHYYLLF